MVIPSNWYLIWSPPADWLPSVAPVWCGDWSVWVKGGSIRAGGIATDRWGANSFLLQHARISLKWWQWERQLCQVKFLLAGEKILFASVCQLCNWRTEVWLTFRLVDVNTGFQLYYQKQQMYFNTQVLHFVDGCHGILFLLYPLYKPINFSILPH